MEKYNKTNGVVKILFWYHKACQVGSIKERKIKITQNKCIRDLKSLDLIN